MASFAVRITVAGSLDGSTPLPDGPYSAPGPDGVIDIEVPGNLGLIDPDFSTAQGASTIPLLIQSVQVKMAAAGISSSGVEVVDNDLNLAYRALDLNGVNNGFSDRSRIIPIGYKLRVRGAGAGHIVRLSLFQLTDPGDIAVVGTIPAPAPSPTPTPPIFGSEFNSAESLPQSTNNTTTFVTKVSLTTPGLPAGVYRIGYSYTWGINSTAESFRAQVDLDTTTLLFDHFEEPADDAGTQLFPAAGFAMVSLTAGVHTFRLRFSKAGILGVVSARISAARLELWRVA